LPRGRRIRLSYAAAEQSASQESTDTSEDSDRDKGVGKQTTVGSIKAPRSGRHGHISDSATEGTKEKTHLETQIGETPVDSHARDGQPSPGDKDGLIHQSNSGSDGNWSFSPDR
jgi:hypothetical protein